MATIDVLLPVRNGMPFLSEAIDSIRNQGFRDWRLLVLDHGSTDRSLALAQRYAEIDSRIEVHSHPEAQDVTALRNIGMAKCDCRYLMLQDADDVSLPDRMAHSMLAFDQRPGLLLVGGEAVLIDLQGARIGYMHLPHTPDAVLAASFFYNPIAHPTIAADFGFLQRLGAAYGKDLLNPVQTAESLGIKSLAEDYVLFGQLAQLGPCANLARPLIHYRRHPKSVSIANPKTQVELSLKVSRFLAKSFCRRQGLAEFDPGSFCNHADYVFDFHQSNYDGEFSRMAQALRAGLGISPVLERELAFRKVLSRRGSVEMVSRFIAFELRYTAMPTERRTVRNWLLRNIRRGKYVCRVNETIMGARLVA